MQNSLATLALVCLRPGIYRACSYRAIYPVTALKSGTGICRRRGVGTIGPVTGNLAVPHSCLTLAVIRFTSDREVIDLFFEVACCTAVIYPVGRSYQSTGTLLINKNLYTDPSGSNLLRCTHRSFSINTVCTASHCRSGISSVTGRRHDAGVPVSVGRTHDIWRSEAIAYVELTNYGLTVTLIERNVSSAGLGVEQRIFGG